MKLEKIGFYSMSDDRALTASSESRLQRCELILTDKCNFNCPYCHGMMEYDKGDMARETAFGIVEWCDEFWIVDSGDVENSKGVQAEIGIAETYNKPVRYIEV